MYKINPTARICLNLIRTSNRSGSHLNCVRFFRNNTIKHEMAKAKLCLLLLKSGHEFFTEAIFENGKRADVVCIDLGICYEIRQSETIEELAEKEETYPEELIMYSYAADEVLNENFHLDT